MAAVVTQPPVIYNTVAPARSGIFAPFNFFGPYEYGSPSRLYVVLYDQVTPRLAVYKSTDSGVTWTAQDAANGPAVDSGTNNYMVAQRGNILTIVYPPAAYTGQRIVTFDVSTDTFGVPSAAGPSTQGHRAWILQLPTSGDCYVIYARNAPPLELFFRVFSGGVWGAEVPLTSEGVNCTLYQVMLDPDERAHAFYRIPGSSLKTVTILGGVAGVATVIQALTADDYENLLGQPSIWGTKIILPYGFDPTSAGRPLTAALIGDPYNAPVWSLPAVVDTLPTVTVGGADGDVFALVSLDGLTAFVFWIALDYSNPSAVIDQTWYVANSGSGWGAPVLYYDAVANPELEDPSILPINQDLHTISVAALLDGSFGVSTALEEGIFCAGYYLLGAGCDITITAGGIVVPSGAPFALPPGLSGVPYGPIIIEATEGPVATWEYSVTSGSPPPGITIGPGTPSNPTPTTDSTDGVPIAGTPATTSWTGPVTTIWTHKVRLIA